MIRVQLDWWKLREIAQAKPEHYELLRGYQEMPTLSDILENKGFVNFEGYINDPADLPDEVLERATFKPLKPLKLMTDDGRIDTRNVKQALQTHQVHLPGNELMRISEAAVFEDCCTDELNAQLKQGWRIIAVCPQPSRRPDYVLGRSGF